MAIQVTKLDGSLEEFTPEKIVVSCIKSGAPATFARETAEAVEKRVYDKIPTSEIRSVVLEQLKAENPDWEQYWLLYEKAVKKRR
ncbi:MAG: ATP cone domain-containing protein [Candidatus Geothermarchaeales archaeon]